MTIPLGPIRLTIRLARARAHQQGWEAWVASGLDDDGLARLNHGNTRGYESAYWTGVRLLHGGRAG